MTTGPHLSPQRRAQIIIAVISLLIGGALSSFASAMVIVERLGRLEERVQRIETDVLSDAQLRALIQSEDLWAKDKVAVLSELADIRQRLMTIGEAVARIDERTSLR